jgi:hypothetical protein
MLLLGIRWLNIGFDDKASSNGGVDDDITRVDRLDAATPLYNVDSVQRFAAKLGENNITIEWWGGGQKAGITRAPH